MKSVVQATPAFLVNLLAGIDFNTEKRNVTQWKVGKE